MEDVFVLEAPDLGEMRRVLIGHDNSGFGPGWKLEDVTVEDLNAAMDAPDAHKKQHFAGDVWLDKSKAPYQTQAELLPSDGVQRAKAKKVKYTARSPTLTHSFIHSFICDCLVIEYPVHNLSARIKRGAQLRGLDAVYTVIRSDNGL